MVEQDIPEKSRIKEKRQSLININKGYFIILIIILGLGHVLDEYASLAPGMVQSSIIDEFFVLTGWKTQTEAMQLLTMLGVVSLFLVIIVSFYKRLIDRFGRKPFFIIAIAGMTIGSLIMVVARSFWPYWAGSLFLTFFIANDMQYMYITEETPSNKRIQFFSYAKILGLLGLLLVPLIRSFTVVEGSENWRPVLYVPVIIGVIVLVLSILFLKETQAFRVMQQERSQKEVETAQKEKPLSLKEAWRSLKAMPTWSQFKWLLILSLLGAPFAMLNQSYSEIFMDQAGVSLADRNIVLTVSTISVGVAYFINGLIADKIGRKAAMVIFSLLIVFCLVGEYFAMWAAPTSTVRLLLLILAGASQGLRIGAFWSVGDVRGMMINENVPTRLRGNSLAIGGILTMLVLLPTIPAVSGMIGMFPGNVQMVLLIFGIPIALITILVTTWKLRETVHVDINHIEG